MAEMIIGQTDDGKPIKIGIPEPPTHVSAPKYSYRYQAYPKTVYKNVPDPDEHTPITARTVASFEAWQALGAGWVESPTQFEREAPAPAVSEPGAVPKKRGRKPKAVEVLEA
jgi:hypothetical protein